MKIQFMVFIAMYLIHTRQHIDVLVWIIALSVAYFGIKGGIFTVLQGGAYHVRGPLQSFIGGNNEIGLALIMTIPLMRYCQLAATHWVVRWGFIPAILLTVLAMVLYFVLYLFGTAPTGFMTLLLIILFLGAVQLFCFSIVAEYLAQIFEEIKFRPINIVKRVVNDRRTVPRQWLGNE